MKLDKPVEHDLTGKVRESIKTALEVCSQKLFHEELRTNNAQPVYQVSPHVCSHNINEKLDISRLYKNDEYLS